MVSTRTSNPPYAIRLQSNGIALEFILARRGSFIDFVTMLSRLEHNPRKNNGLVRCGVDQTRERYLTFDFEILAHAFLIFRGAMVSPDLTCLLGNPALLVV